MASNLVEARAHFGDPVQDVLCRGVFVCSLGLSAIWRKVLYNFLLYFLNLITNHNIFLRRTSQRSSVLSAMYMATMHLNALEKSQENQTSCTQKNMNLHY